VIGYCGLSAQEFWAMTPREVEWRIEADVDRENRQLERVAQLACWVMNPWLSKGQRYTVKKLVGRKPPKRIRE
jgi:hypothetical protein